MQQRTLESVMNDYNNARVGLATAERESNANDITFYKFARDMAMGAMLDLRRNNSTATSDNNDSTTTTRSATDNNNNSNSSDTIANNTPSE